MTEKDEVMIDEELIKNSKIKNKNSAKGENNNENVVKYNTRNESNDIKNIEEKQVRSQEDTNIENNNETENINTNTNKNNNNITEHTNILFPSTEREGENNQHKLLISQKESASNINTTNMYDDVSLNQAKDELVHPNQIHINEHNSNNKNLNESNKNIIEEEESKTIENMLNKDLFRNQRFSDNNGNISIFKHKNQLYFTEADIPPEKKNKIKKSYSSLSYVLSPITPIQESKNSFLYKTPGNFSKLRQDEIKKLRNSINAKLNNLSPEEYKKKRFVYKYNFHPLKYRIQKMEEEIENQNKYDFQRAMKEFQMKCVKEKKFFEKQKQILAIHKTANDKLREMHEKREKMMNERKQKIMQNINRKKCNKKIIIKNFNKSFETKINYNMPNHHTDMGQNKWTDSIHSNYLNDKNEKFPKIHNMPKYMQVKNAKNKKEEEFCFLTNKRLQEKEENHKNNYQKYFDLISEKIFKINKKDKEKSLECLKITKSRDVGLEEKYIEKDMIKRYNINQNLLKENSNKFESLKNIQKNLDDAKERREMIERKEEEQRKKVIRRINREHNKTTISHVKELKIRNHYANLQKEHLRKSNQNEIEYHNELVLRLGDNNVIVNELQKEEPIIKQALLKRNLKEQRQKSQRLKKMEIRLSKLGKENINTKNEETKKRIILETIRIELEKKEKELEDKAKGTKDQ